MIPILDLDFKFDLYFVLDLKFHHYYDFKLMFPALAMQKISATRNMINHGWYAKIDQIISNTYATCATSIYAISNLSDQSNLRMAKNLIFCSFFCIFS